MSNFNGVIEQIKEIEENHERELSFLRETLNKQIEELNNEVNRLKSSVVESKDNNSEIVGYIYIATNKHFAGLVKIGYANDVKRRLNELFNTSIPDPFECYARYAVTKKLSDVEVHAFIDALNPALRVNNKREFYSATPEFIYDLFKNIAIMTGTEDRLEYKPFEEKEEPIVVEEPSVVKNTPVNNSTNSLIDNYKTRNSDEESEKERRERTHTFYEQTELPDGFYTADNGLVAAFVENGEWTILKGSKIREEAVPSFRKDKMKDEDKLLRKKYSENGILTEDVQIGKRTISGAAVWVRYQEMNGWTYWCTEDGILIKEAFPRDKR